MLLKPTLRAINLDPELRSRIEAPVFDALFDHVDRYLSNGDTQSLSLTQCLEILAATLPKYQDTITAACDYGKSPEGAVAPSSDLIQLFANGLAESVGYLRREGSVALREGVSRDNDDANSLWRSLFQDRLRSVVEGSGFLLDREKRETCDLAVESL
ncbi:MAG: hypothetical protein AAF585_14890 [Verrucomicrobiota bacterium]